MLAGDPRFEAIDAMTSKDFEFALVDLFELLQYEDVQRIGTFEDDADLIVVEDGERIAVQAKHASMPVRIETVQPLVDGMRRYGCVRGLIVTNSFFTDEAIAFARECGDRALGPRDSRPVHRRRRAFGPGCRSGSLT